MENEVNLNGFASEEAEIVADFLKDSRDMIEETEIDALSLQQHLESGVVETEIINKIFRAFHSIKGAADFLKFVNIKKAAHSAENLLGLIRSNEISISLETIDLLILAIDVLKEGFSAVERVFDDTSVTDCAFRVSELISLHIKERETEESSEQFSIYEKDFEENPSFLEVPKIGNILEKEGKADSETIEKALEIQARPLGKILVDMGACSEKDIEQAIVKQEEKRQELGLQNPNGESKAKHDIRVDVEKLDVLTNLIGELVIVNNMLDHVPSSECKHFMQFSKTAKQMGKIVRELREIAMVIRMVPVKNLFRKMFRLVHDVAEKSNKKVELILFGEETEIDKTVIEMIQDPILHIIRNAVDHGIGTSEERIKQGKSEKGTIRLSAKHEEGEVKIIIEDDGNGIKKEKVLKKALEKGMFFGDTANLTDKEIFSFIFEPGFSTAEKVTEISGRGVGMDVVKRNMDAINGKIDVWSAENVGTTITLRIPLTLAIIEGMQMMVGNTSFMIPTLAAKEFFKPKKSLITIAPDGLEIIKIRDEIIPILRLHKIYKREPVSENLEDGMLIIVEIMGENAALFVDKIIGQQQAVIKAVPSSMGAIQGVSGCTILGNGKISLILDVEKIMEMSKKNKA